MTEKASFKTRFCPSPTGLMHLGNLRTALFNVLLAKAHHADKAQFLLRIEDTDRVRSEEIFTENLLRDLKWLGVDWQEGPEHGGPHEPYFQSMRSGIYEKFYQQLHQQQQAYWCFCTDTELTITRKTQVQAGLPPRYPGTCRHLTGEQKAIKVNKGIKPALRFRIPDGETVHFEDFIQGPKNFETDDIGDFIIQKADGSASFMFCNAVDDALMEVTHVMRGEDHLTNTPRQLLILKALGLKAPRYGHMPLILGFDGKPLSKRNGSQSVESLREQGFFPIAINNYLSRLGHYFDKNDVLSLEDLGKNFSVSHIGRSSARFDMAQLRHWQKEVVLKQEIKELEKWLAPFVKDIVPKDKILLFIQTVKQNIILPEDAIFWAKQFLTDDIDWEEEALEIAGDLEREPIVQALEEAINDDGDDYAGIINRVSTQTGAKGKRLFSTVRAVTTARINGPELVKIFPLMGKTQLLRRIALANEQRKKKTTS